MFSKYMEEKEIVSQKKIKLPIYITDKLMQMPATKYIWPLNTIHVYIII